MVFIFNYVVWMIIIVMLLVCFGNNYYIYDMYYFIYVIYGYIVFYVMIKWCKMVVIFFFKYSILIRWF